MSVQIDARVKQKKDTLANWNANTLILLDGEQAFVVAADGVSPIYYKIGDGTKKFADLPLNTYTGAVDIRWFGAKGDGVFNVGTGLYTGSDDTLAIQAAINASAGKNKIVFPKSTGVYLITAPIQIPFANTQLEGIGVFLKQQTNLKSAIIFTEDNCSITGDWHIIQTKTGDESSFPGGGGGNTTSYGAGITFDRVDGGLCTGVTAIDCGGISSHIGAGFYVTSSKNVIIDKCKAYNCSTAVNTDSIFSESLDNKILHGYWSGCYNGYVGDYTGGHRDNSIGDTVFDCIADTCTNTGFQLDTCPDRWYFTDCRAINCANNGFAMIHSAQNGVLKGCRAISCNIGYVINGIDGSQPSRIVLDNCFARNNVQDGCQLWTSNDVAFLNCFFTLNGRYGLLSPSNTFPKRVNIYGGSYSDNAGDGMFINDPYGMRIINPTIKGNRTDATTYPDGSGITIRQVNVIPKDILISGVTFYDLNLAIPSTQKYGFNFIATQSENINLTHNYYGTQGTAEVNITGGQALINRIFDFSSTGAQIQNNLHLGGGINTRIKYILANTTFTTTDSRFISDGANLLHTLPAFSGIEDGFECEVTNANTSACVIRDATSVFPDTTVAFQQTKIFVCKLISGVPTWFVKFNNPGVKFNTGTAGLTIFSGSQGLVISCTNTTDIAMNMVVDPSTPVGTSKEIYNYGIANVFIVFNNGITIDGVLSATGSLITLQLKQGEWFKFITVGVNSYITAYKAVKRLEKNTSTGFSFSDANLNAQYPTALQGFEADFSSNIPQTRVTKLDNSPSGAWMVIKTIGNSGLKGQVALVAGTITVAITGVTTSSLGFVSLVTPQTTTLTTSYKITCTTNSITIQANIAGGTINTADISILNYLVI